MNQHLLLLVAYSAVLVAVGVLVGRRVRTSAAFFVAGRGLGAGLLCATMLAANIGAGSTIGAASLGYRDGLAAWWWVGAAGVGTLLLAFTVGPRIWKVARDHELLTVGDYLEWRYGPRVRLVTTALLWVATLTILAAQLVAVAFVLDVVAGIPTQIGCILAGVVMTAYFTVGGLLTAAWVNLLQLVVLLGGFLLAVPWAVARAGGFAGVLASVPQSGDYLDPLVSGASGVHYVALLVPAFIVSPGLLQKIYGARDPRALRLGVTACGVALLLFALLPPLLGMVAHVYDDGLTGTRTNLALPIVLTQGLPAALGALGLAAVFSAEVSSADAILFMLSTSLSEDLYRRFLRRDAGDARVLAVARLGAVLGGVLGTALALWLGSVIESMSIFYSLLGVTLFVPVVAGLYSRRPGERAALAAIIVGVSTYLAARYLLVLPGTALLNANVLGLAASAVAYGLVAILPTGAKS